jgi:Fis family transcriptional regulator, factor for inversion stimulation protein
VPRPGPTPPERPPARALVLEGAPDRVERACAAAELEVTRPRSAAEARRLLARDGFDLVDGRLARPMPLEWEIGQRVELFYEQLRGHSATGLYQAVMREVERPLLAAALARAKGVRADAARFLGIDRGTLARRMRALGVTERDPGRGAGQERPAAGPPGHPRAREPGP